MQLISSFEFRSLTGALSRLCAVVALGAVLNTPVAAQSLFSPAIMVNDDVITHYELEQRELFMRLLRVPGDPVETAREELILDRLKLPAIEDAGIELAEEDIQAGMDDFAKRAGLSTEDFLKALDAGGVSVETLRDFVTVGLAWREYIRARFLGQARPSPEEIDRAIGREGGGGGLRVLLSEIIIPITPQTLDAVEAEAERISKLEGLDAFSAEATRFSAAETRDNGGRLDWLPINDLPPSLRPILLALSPGEISSPIPLPNAVALFQLRDIQEYGTPTPSYSAIEYAIYYMAGGRSPETLSAANALRNRVDTCNDLYGVALGLPSEALDRRTQKPSEIPRDIALELAKLDDGEVSTALTTSQGQSLMFIMMCGRSASINDDATRDEITVALTQQRLNTLSETFLSQLRANSVIVEK